MPEPRLQFAQKAFIVDRDRVLLVRKSGSDPHHPGCWEVPGGRLKVGQDADLDEHIRREVYEEVGLRVEPGPPFHLWDWWMPDGEPGEDVRVVAVARTCRAVGGTAVTDEHRVPDDHLGEAAWVPVRDLADYDVIPGLKPVMEHFRTDLA
ncbi:NUDIX domain-containing protein [Actinocorallia populi]|uniref:NUDIX domain-containing protein n=1 Tax=Actinocorallia populi TaxID=2079200 RepID=UPI000D095255|nr:NUDIX domain-containing protein [Actinocorallia populi]